MTTLTNRIVLSSFSSLSIATFGLVALLAGSAQAAPTAGGKDRSEAKGGRMCAKLACSDAQKAKIKQIRTSAKTPQQKAARDNLRKLHEQVQAELRKPSPDARAIERLDAQIAAQKTALHSQRRASQLQILAVLTPDQRAKFLDHAGKRGKGKGGHRKGGKGQRR
jgi:Spy/CpxP family protein refolding chaperone